MVNFVNALVIAVVIIGHKATDLRFSVLGIGVVQGSGLNERNELQKLVFAERGHGAVDFLSCLQLRQELLPLEQKPLAQIFSQLPNVPLFMGDNVSVPCWEAVEEFCPGKGALRMESAEEEVEGKKCLCLEDCL